MVRVDGEISYKSVEEKISVTMIRVVSSYITYCINNPYVCIMYVLYLLRIVESTLLVYSDHVVPADVARFAKARPLRRYHGHSMRQRRVVTTWCGSNGRIQIGRVMCD